MRSSDLQPVQSIKINAVLGELVRKRRTQLGLTLAQLAELTGIGEDTLAAYECGQMRICSDQLVDIAGACKLPLTDFFPATQESARPDLSALRAEAHNLVDSLTSMATLQAALLFLRHGDAARSS